MERGWEHRVGPKGEGIQIGAHQAWKHPWKGCLDWEDKGWSQESLQGRS